LFLTGTDGPSVSYDLPFRYLLPKPSLQETLKSYGGISEELLENEEAFNFFEPIIRADFKVIETWQYQMFNPLDIPASVITGTLEGMSTRDIQAWQKEFSQPIDFLKLPGKHFFPFENPREFIKTLSNQLIKSDSTKQTQLLNV